MASNPMGTQPAKLPKKMHSTTLLLAKRLLLVFSPRTSASSVVFFA